MADVPVVSDKMRYGLKPIAVESKTHILTIPCIGTNTYAGNTSSTIIFRIQHNPSGRFVDPTATRFKLTFTCNWPATLKECHAFMFERGPESIIRRFQIKDIQGRILEDIDNYNLTYAITEICTNDNAVRKARGLFYMEGNAEYPDMGGWIRHPKYGLQNGSDGSASVTFDLTFTPFSGVFGGACEKYIPLSVMEGMEIHIQLENPQNCIQYQFVAPRERGAHLIGGNLVQWGAGALYTNTSSPLITAGGAFADINQATQFFASHRTRTNVALSNQEAFNISGGDNSVVWSNFNPVTNADNAFNALDDGNYRWNLTDNFRSQVTYTITDPKLLVVCLDVEPAVNAALINAAKDPRDGMIRIQTFSWSTYSTQIQMSNAGLFSWLIPVSVTSMKSIFFTLRDNSHVENINYMRSGFEHRGLLRYRILIGGLPLNADWVEVSKGDATKKDTHSEPIGTLMEAWSVHHKTDSNPTMFTLENYTPARWHANSFNMYQKEYNAVFGQELESFTQKSGIIQSGLNTMQTTFVLEMEFGPNTKTVPVFPPAYSVGAAAAAGYTGSEQCVLYNLSAPYELRAYVMYDKVIAFDETSGSIRAEY